MNGMEKEGERDVALLLLLYNTIPKQIAPRSRTLSGLNYAVGPCITSLITGQYEMIVIELAELLGE